METFTNSAFHLNSTFQHESASGNSRLLIRYLLFAPPKCSVPPYLHKTVGLKPSRHWLSFRLVQSCWLHTWSKPFVLFLRGCEITGLYCQTWDRHLIKSTLLNCCSLSFFHIAVTSLGQEVFKELICCCSCFYRRFLLVETNKPLGLFWIGSEPNLWWLHLG